MHSDQAPARQRPVIRVFVSSTFSDFVAERNALADQVWPELERYCRQRGFTFQAIDLRWGVPSEAGLDHRTMQICFEELHRAQETSPEPNFLILLGNKYGWRPLPETISEAEYDRLFEHTQSPTEQGTLATWYRRDTNARPTHYVLRARTDSPDDEDYTRAPDAEGRLHDTDEWRTVQETLWSIVNRAYPDTLLSQRFAHGMSDIPAIVRFQGSATEQEIWHGALRVDNARDHVVALFREIDRTGGDPAPSQLKQFVDLRLDQSPNNTVSVALAQLKTQVEQKLAPEPILRANCCWEKDANGQFTGEVTADHVAPMCEAILTRLREIVLRQINDYWGADLSAENATVAVVQGSPQELNLELRDHRRFAQERGPVDLFVGRDEQVRTIREYLQSTTNRPLIVHGPSGSGKTALLAYVAQRPFLPDAGSSGVSPLILTRFIGAHPESSTLRGLVTSLCRELRVHFPVDDAIPDSLQKLIEEFYSQLGRVSGRQPIYVFLDALDQLEAADQAREVDWLRSAIAEQTEDKSCHARIVVSCLSPSPEFPAESEACEPFRKLQSRGLLADEELGALSEPAARQLVRRWLADQQRGLTDEQWQQVDEAIHGSSACRQPLYLKVLHEQLRNWPEFKKPEPLPASLTLLLLESLTRLCQPNQHGPLPRIALGYLVSARYGLSEGELLEILLCDPEMQAQLEAAAKAYGHHLPPGAKHFPVAPWARLRSDLRVYLSERAAPGTTVLYCYHRQVEQAVRTLLLADDATRTECRYRLADYFDGRWDQSDAHALMELPDLLLALPDHRRLYDRLTNFAFPLRKTEVGLLESIPDDYIRLRAVGSADMRAPLDVWRDFFRERGHILRRGVADQSVHKILLQLALEHADDSPITHAAEAWVAEDKCNWLRLQRVPRLPHVTKDPCLSVLEGHTDRVWGALLLSEGRILSWSGDKTLRVWDAARGTSLSVLEGHTGIINGALLLPGYRILSWSGDKTVCVWDGVTGARLRILGHPHEVYGALLLPDGRILSRSKDNILRLWDVTSGALLQVLQGHTGLVYGVLTLADERILSWSADSTLRLWDSTTGAPLRILRGHAKAVKGALPLIDGRILSWSYDGNLRLWDGTSGAPLQVLKGHAKAVIGAKELSNGRLLSWSEDNTLRLWDGASGAPETVLNWPNTETNFSIINGAKELSGVRILSWSEDNTLRLWDGASGSLLQVLQGHTSSVNGALTLADGRILSWSGNTLQIWDGASGVPLQILQGHAKPVEGALLLTDGRILSWSYDSTLRIWNVARGAPEAVPNGLNAGVSGVLTLSDGRILSWSVDGTLRLWDRNSGALLHLLERHSIGHWGYPDPVIDAFELADSRIISRSRHSLHVWDGVSGVALHFLKAERLPLHEYPKTISSARELSDGRILFEYSNDELLRIWDSGSSTPPQVLKGHTKPVNGTLVLADGRILSWSKDNTLRLWDGASGSPLQVFQGHTSSVNGALTLADGRILSWSEDNTLRLWDGASGAPLQVLQGHTNSVNGALTLADGRILSWSWYTLQIWNGASGVPLQILQGHARPVEGALPLANGQILSWAYDDTLRLWDGATGECLELVTEAGAPNRHPEWWHALVAAKKPQSVSNHFRCEASGRAARLHHMSLVSAMVSWHADSDCHAFCILTDGTLVTTQVNGQVCILKLHHGQRRISLADAEALLMPSKALSPI